MITLYGAAPFDESPRVPEMDPLDPFIPYTPQPAIKAPVAMPRGVAIDQQLMTEETIVAVEAYAAAMVAYLSLPRDQRAAVDRYIESARILTGRVDVDAETYQLASQLAAGMRKVAK